MSATPLCENSVLVDISDTSLTSAPASIRIDVSKSSPLYLHHLMHRRHHALVEMAHDPHRASDNERDDQNTEGQRQYVVGIVRRRGEMQEENQMHADLRDRQRDQRD